MECSLVYRAHILFSDSSVSGCLVLVNDVAMSTDVQTRSLHSSGHGNRIDGR